MHTEWMKVMLEEVARKREDAERGREEEARRDSERAVAGQPAPKKRSEAAAQRRSS